MVESHLIRQYVLKTKACFVHLIVRKHWFKTPLGQTFTYLKRFCLVEIISTKSNFVLNLNYYTTRINMQKTISIIFVSNIKQCIPI